MNERIKELAAEAGFIGESMYPIFGTCQETALKNFAELIVRECAQICKTVNSVKVVNASDDYQEGREMGSIVCMEKIKKHFGVEE